jgi:hypothetical protein
LNTTPTLWYQWRRMSNKKMKQLFYKKWSQSAWSKQRCPISDCQSVGSPIENQSSPDLMTCPETSDDTSIFIWIGDPLKIKDHTGRKTHKDIGPNKQHIKSPIITTGWLLVKCQLKEYVRIMISSLYLLWLESGSN